MQDEKTISGSIVHITDGAEADARAIVVEIEPVQSGSGTPSPSNVRPITGWDDVSVYVTGVNIWDEEWELGAINPTTGALEQATNRIRSKNFTPCVGGTTYYIKEPTTTKNARLVFYDASENYVGESGWTGNEAKTFPQGAVFFKFYMSATYGTTYNHDISINYPSTDHDYHAYNGNTTTTTLPSTTYGGTIDLVSGVLVDKMGITDLSGLTWTTRYTGTVNRALSAQVPSSFVGYPSTEFNAVAEQYEAIRGISGASYLANPDNVDVGLYWYSNPQSPTTTNVYVVCPLATSPSGKLVYELATPTTAQLTGQQIELLRDCFVWADSGDITVTYETELLDGRFHKIKVNGNSIIAPNNFELEREDVYTAEYTTCTGKLIADKIGWKYADTTMQWDTLPDDMLAILTGTTGAFTLKFTDSDGSHTENVIRLGVRNTATRFTDDFGNALWRNIELEVSFTNVH